jgi:hypothetical protein
MLVIAGFVLCLAAPRFAASVATGLTNAATPAVAAARERAAAAYGRALSWLDSPQNHAALGTLALAKARRLASAGDAEAASGQLDRSAAESRAALALSPLQPYVWARLAQVDLAVGAASANVARDVAMSMRTAPWDPSLVTVRLGLTFAVWDELDEKAQKEFEEQIRHAARLYPTALASQARQHRAQSRVLQALEDKPDLLRRFSAAYSRI